MYLSNYIKILRQYLYIKNKLLNSSNLDIDWVKQNLTHLDYDIRDLKRNWDLANTIDTQIPNHLAIISQDIHQIAKKINNQKEAVQKITAEKEK